MNSPPWVAFTCSYQLFCRVLVVLGVAGRARTTANWREGPAGRLVQPAGLYVDVAFVSVASASARRASGSSKGGAIVFSWTKASAVSPAHIIEELIITFVG